MYPATLHEALAHETAYELEQRAVPITEHPPTRKSTLVALLHAYLAEPDNLRDLLSRLDPRQQAAVSEAAHAEDGRFPQEIFAAKYGGQPTWDRGSVLPLLFYRGVIPPDLRLRLRPLVPAPAPFVLPTAASPPTTLPRPGGAVRRSRSATPRQRHRRTSWPSCASATAARSVAARLRARRLSRRSVRSRRRSATGISTKVWP